MLVALAFALRLVGLTATSLWYDETFMLYHAQQGVIAGPLGLLREDNALPLHGLLLALWVPVAGSGEFAARYLSVLLGTLATPLILQLGRRLLGRRSGGWGAALAFAALPIHVYYAQEVRMYALAVPLAAAFAVVAWRLVERGRGAAAYVALGTAMLAAHLYTGLLWASVLLWGTWASRPRDARLAQRGAWFRANGLLALCAVPIAVWALWRARVDATAVSAIPATVLRGIPAQFGVGQYVPPPGATIFLAVTALALATAGWGLLRARRPGAVLWLALGLVVPVALLLASTGVKAKWSERYLLPSFGLALVLGVGVGWEVLLRRREGVARVGGLLLAGSWLTLALLALARQSTGTWAVAVTDEWHPRPDFRGVARYIEAHDAEDDAIVVVGGYAAHTLAYYYDGPAHLFGLPADTRLLDTHRPVDLETLTVLEQEAGSARHLWLVLWQAHLADPTNLIQSVLVEACRRRPVMASFTNVHLLRFDLDACRPLDRWSRPPHPLAASFCAPLCLTGYDVQRNDETWEVELWWQATGTPEANYSVFVHLLDAAGDIVAQHDHIAGADAYPTSRWAPDTRLRNRFFLHVPGGTCPNCTLFVGLYTSAGRLPLQDGRDGVQIPLAP